MMYRMYRLFGVCLLTLSTIDRLGVVTTVHAPSRHSHHASSTGTSFSSRGTDGSGSDTSDVGSPAGEFTRHGTPRSKSSDASITSAESHSAPVVVEFAPLLADVALTTAEPAETQLADLIESIDVTAHEIIVLTSKVGPSETAQVAITVVDVETWNELPPINLTGIFLLVTRGRYTINFLSPNHWYGIVFRCEQRMPRLGIPLLPAGASTSVDSHVNEERHLVKTHKADGSRLDTQPLVGVGMQRLSNAGKSLENLVITIKWEQHLNERSNLDAIANITLFCKQHIKYKQVWLFGREIEKSVEVKLENHFEIMELYNETRQIIASITPKNCPRICWNVELVAETPRGEQFRRAATRDCETIAAVSATTNLREYLGYELHGRNLIVHTNYSAPECSGYESDAYVQLVALELHQDTHDQKVHDNSTVRFKTFSTSVEHTNDFALNHLEPQKLYAIEYKYGKESPFAYTESRRFIVETPADEDVRVMSEPINGAVGPLHRQWPIRVIIERVTPVIIHMPTRTHNESESTPSDPDLLPHQISLLMENKKRWNIFENVDQPIAHKVLDRENAEVNITPVKPINSGSTLNHDSADSKHSEGAGRQKLVVDDKEYHAPKIIMQLEPAFQDYRIGIDLEPFCELSMSKQTIYQVEESEERGEGSEKQETSESEPDQPDDEPKNTKSRFWLTRDEPNHELRHLDVVGAVCGKTPAHALCRLKFLPNATNWAQGAARCLNGAKLCYTPSVYVREKMYAIDRRCVDVAKQIGAHMAADAKAAQALARSAVVDEPVGSHARHSTSPFSLPTFAITLSILYALVR